ncbi:NAD-dependent epimerase/dehydratase family protein [Parashewanella curva]|uniref:NAD-dependent epimerase/dehydratase family protein n=1 Tax=Parashewanella curva TaxID=2338552 RepID=A0A3L8PX69_9GAMM|nr:2-alkyl-3-oxoalkanoate reductase [Parashewanella curva]RLV60057.1 NAD-dependent epimerase/dehydratase family protein [Parashewanella curva]
MNTLHEIEQQALEKLASKVSHVFVTGAGGFLGFAICQRLIAAGIKVTGFARGNYPKLEQLGVTMVQGDLAEPQTVAKAMQGCDFVFHVASKAGVWGSKESYFNPNVKGAENVIKASKSNGIKYIVYTSTPSVTFDGHDEKGINESTPYASQFMNYYGLSKSIAEQAVLSANDANLKTVAIRPHLIWGPNDPHLVPRVIERGRAGRLKLVGKQDKLVDTIYIDNAAYSHILAAIALTEEDSKCAGRAYFVSNDEPVTMASMLNQILACVQLPPITKRVPVAVAYSVGVVLELIYKLLNKQDEPIMTRFVAKQLSCSHYYDISAAKEDFGYQPIISITEGMERLKQSL